MKQINNVYLIGLGAIGGAYGSRIMENYPESLQIVADADRTERYGKSGVTVNGQLVPFRYITPEQVNEKAELIVIAVKQHHLKQTIENIRRLVGSDTIILSLLNGISSEEILGEEFGMDKMLHSFCVGTDAVRIGTDIRFSKIGRIVFGDRDNAESSAKVSAVREYFDRAGVPYEIPADIMRELWWKFTLNVGVNQVSAVLRVPYGELIREEYTRELMFDASREVITIARKAGIQLSEEDIQKYAGIVASLSPEGKPSMLQDVEAGRKTEVEIFSGTVIELGRRYDVATPVNDILFRLLKALEQIRRD